MAGLLVDALDAPVETVLDPACGPGSLLEAVERRAPGRFRLVGYDVDRASVASARSRIPRADCRVLDALVGQWGCAARSTPVGVIVNPPWGARAAQPAELLRARGYRLARGQYDSYDLFVERLVRDLPRGSTVAAIVPDSIFLPQHEPLRRLLLAETTLLTLARLGEGLFPAVYRGVVVTVFRTARPAAGHRVRCMRLRKADRLAVANGVAESRRTFAQLAHEVEQAWFSSTGRWSLDIHVRESDRRVLAKYGDRRLSWDRWYEFTRGVEIGKGGRAVACPGCGYHRPEPRTSQYRCRGCGQVRRKATGAVETIIRPATTADGDATAWRPVLVGEDVNRHRVHVRRRIRTAVPGIDYKEPAIYARPKVLVRKTGLGIKAVLDEAGLWTTQVVYHIARRRGSPGLALGYVAGVLSSRCLLAYHLSTSGELEWRSHPYLTPKVIRTLPVPEPGAPGSTRWQRAAEIAALVRGMARAGYDRATDFRVEALVARMFGLDAGDLEWVAGVLDAADDLEAIRSLRLDPAADLPGVVAGA